MALAYLEGVASTVMARFERRVRIFTRETIEKTSIRLETAFLYALILCETIVSEISTKGRKRVPFSTRSAVAELLTRALKFSAPATSTVSSGATLRRPRNRDTRVYIYRDKLFSPYPYLDYNALHRRR